MTETAQINLTPSLEEIRQRYLAAINRITGATNEKIRNGPSAYYRWTPEELMVIQREYMRDVEPFNRELAAIARIEGPKPIAGDLPEMMK